MANENWEEISAWDVEEDMDMDMTQRITVHTAHKYPTYAAATKWGSRRRKSAIKIDADGDNAVEKKQEEKGKENVRKGILLGAPAKPTNDNTSLPGILKGDRKIDCDDGSYSKHPSLNCISTPPPPSDPDPVEINKSLARRHNNHVHKLSSQRLLNQLSNPVIMELHADLVKGDTNRDPEFKKYKMLKKSMKYKNGSTKSKDRKGVDKMRVEVW
ncbi:16539_t:CDS:2 [Acaulospora colombiana]|uniref:16539_t:CDS:1 n=1 Tax=Acaulospora colombiana TaxID=27376 RepID=A0ACA9KZR6_9GLOM|nr:16539_t:CDS:2 [Acaulospora colombiana]